MMYLTVWHYGVIALLLIGLALMLFATFKSVEKKSQLVVSIALIVGTLVFAGIVLSVMDTYLKKAKLTKLKVRKMNNKVYYSGYIKNVGKYKIGFVKLSVELVNRGDINYYEPGTMYEPRNGFDDLFTNDTKVQQVSNDFIVVKNLPPGSTKFFNVSMPYPRYFTKTADKTSLKVH
ncbi:MAG: DUF2393 family protein [Campylobacterota bacterium]|nr:DUF2393 family protein [Campylobacterota bacterium]